MTSTTTTTTTAICPHVLFYFILLYIYLTIYPLISFFFLNVSFFIWFYGKLLLRDYTFYSLFYYCYILLEEGWHGHIVVVVVVVMVVVFLVQTTFFILLYFGLYTIYIHSLLHIKVLFSNLCLISLFNFFFSPCLAFSMAIVKTFYDCQKINKNIWLICYCCHLSLQYLKILYVSLIKIEGERKKDKNMLVGMGVYLVGDLVYTLYYILLFVVCIFCSQITQFCCSCCRHLSFTFTFMFEEEYSVSYFTAIFHNYNTPLFLKCFCFFFFLLFSSNHNCSSSNLPIF